MSTLPGIDLPGSEGIYRKAAFSEADDVSNLALETGDVELWKAGIRQRYAGQAIAPVALSDEVKTWLIDELGEEAASELIAHAE